MHWIFMGDLCIQASIRWVVITTINPPTAAIESLAKIGKLVTFFSTLIPVCGHFCVESMILISYPGQSCLLQSGKLFLDPPPPVMFCEHLIFLH